MVFAIENSILRLIFKASSTRHPPVSTIKNMKNQIYGEYVRHYPRL